MYMKGAFFIARREALVQEFGQAAWDELIAELVHEVPSFGQPFTPTTSVSVHDYIRFQEAWLKRFYAGDERTWFRLGVSAGHWALSQGRYRSLMEIGDIDGTLQQVMPRMWSSFTDSGTLRGRREGARIFVEVSGVEVWHLAIELATMGAAQAVLELASQRPVSSTCVVGAKQGMLGCRYEFLLGDDGG